MLTQEGFRSRLQIVVNGKKIHLQNLVPFRS